MDLKSYYIFMLNVTNVTNTGDDGIYVTFLEVTLFELLQSVMLCTHCVIWSINDEGVKPSVTLRFCNAFDDTM